MKKKPKKKGRKKKLTTKLIQEISKLIEAGNYAKIACLATGIGESTYYYWIEKGEEAKQKKQNNKKLSKDEKLYLEFLESITKSHAKAEIRNVLIVQKGAQKDPKHAEWWLERTNWKTWGRKEYQKHDATVEIKPTKVEEFRKFVKEGEILDKRKKDGKKEKV